MSQLPFLQRATLKKQGGEVIVNNVPITIWPTTAISSRYGEYYDHEAEASLDFVNELVYGPPNRKIEVAGAHYTIIQATPNPYVPHVALILRRAKAGGP